MMRILKCVIIWSISAFFLVAGILKLVDPVEFGRAILRYQLVGAQLAWIGALWLPWLEVLCALGLNFPSWRRAAICLLLGLLIFFEMVLISALMRGLDIDCGCLGTNAPGSLSFAMLRNVFLAAALAILFIFDNARGVKTHS